VRRRGVVVEGRGPSACQLDECEDRLGRVLRRREMKKRGLLNGDGVEPHHMAVIVGQLRVVVIVGPGMVRFEMPMNG